MERAIPSVERVVGILGKPADLRAIGFDGEGDLLGNLKSLLSEEARTRGSVTPARHAEVGLAIARCYAALGMTVDAHEWLVARGQNARRADSPGLIFEFDLARIEFLRRGGDFAGAIVHGVSLWRNQLWSIPARRSAELLVELATSYLRLGYVSRVRACLSEATLDTLRESSPSMYVNAELLLADALWWEALGRVANLRSHVQIISAGENEGVTLRALSERAATAFRSLIDHPLGNPRTRECARAGVLRCRLISGFDPDCVRALEAHWAWQNAQGSVFEADLARLHLGLIQLVHADYRRAHQWLLPLAEAEMERSTRMIGADVLYYIALTLERAKQDGDALQFLRAYLERVRERPSIVEFDPNSVERPTTVNDLQTALAETSAAQVLINRVCDHVRANIQNPLTVADIADRLGVSRRTLEYSFKRDMGTTPKRFLTSLRLSAARQKIVNEVVRTRRDLYRVAEQSGFPNYRAFIRAIRTHMGAKANPLRVQSWMPAER